MRHRATEDKAPRLDASDLVDLAAGPGLHQFSDRTAKRAGVGQQRGDVAKQDTFFGVIRNGADGGFQIMVKGHRGLFSSPSLRAKRSNPFLRAGSMDCFVASAP